MAQYFFLTKNSTLPNLRMEVINDGRNDFRKAYLALQAATVTFTMTNMETGVKKIANAKAYVVEREDTGCEEAYVIEYRWNKRDTDTPGNYIGQFKIKFDDNISIDGMTFPKGELIAPIAEDLIITISDSGIKK
jgi:hypothetical protein